MLGHSKSSYNIWFFSYYLTLPLQMKFEVGCLRVTKWFVCVAVFAEWTTSMTYACPLSRTDHFSLVCPFCCFADMWNGLLIGGFSLRTPPSPHSKVPETSRFVSLGEVFDKFSYISFVVNYIIFNFFHLPLLYCFILYICSVREASMTGLQEITSLTVNSYPDLLQPTVYVSWTSTFYIWWFWFVCSRVCVCTF